VYDVLDRSNAIRRKERTAMSELAHHFAALREVKMHYVTAGVGDQTVVLLHGYPQSWYCWRDVVTELQSEYRLVAPDLRGLGDTTRCRLFPGRRPS
jgi:pimeloyl-ACP methyl ester carboxylesterase